MTVASVHSIPVSSTSLRSDRGRADTIQMIQALADELRADPNAEPLGGLRALVMHVQGDHDQCDQSDWEWLAGLRLAIDLADHEAAKKPRRGARPRQVL